MDSVSNSMIGLCSFRAKASFAGLMSCHDTCHYRADADNAVPMGSDSAFHLVTDLLRRMFTLFLALIPRRLLPIL